MIIVRTYKDNAWYLAGITTAIEWEKCTKRLKYYFSNVKKIKEKILTGKIIDTPYVIFQRDRRKKDIPVRKDQRKYFNLRGMF